MYTYDPSLLSDLYYDAYGRRPSPVFWSIWNAKSTTESYREAVWLKILDVLNEEKETENAY